MQFGDSAEKGICVNVMLSAVFLNTFFFSNVGGKLLEINCKAVFEGYIPWQIKFTIWKD